MNNFLIEIKNWLDFGTIIECVPNGNLCEEGFHANRHVCRFVLENQRNILASSNNSSFFVVALKDKLPELKQFLNEAKIPCRETCNFSPLMENVPDIKIKQEFLINTDSHIYVFYKCLQYTIVYFCEEKWNEIGGNTYTYDSTYLWASSFLFDSNTTLVPAIEMQLKNYDWKDDKKCRIEMKPLIMKKFPLERLDSEEGFKPTTVVYTIPRLTEAKIASTFFSESSFEKENYDKENTHWKRTWGIQRPDFKECNSHRFIAIQISDNNFNKTYHISCLFNKLPEPIECRPEDDEVMKLYVQFIVKFQQYLIQIGNLPIVENVKINNSLTI